MDFDQSLGSSADGFVTDVWCFKFSRSLISVLWGPLARVKFTRR